MSTKLLKSQLNLLVNTGVEKDNSKSGGDKKRRRRKGTKKSLDDHQQRAGDTTDVERTVEANLRYFAKTKVANPEALQQSVSSSSR
jgi:hypothetical protein